MSQADLANRLNEAIALIQAGKLAEGRALLIPLSEQYPTLEQIWLWMAASSENTEDRVAALRRVLSINPRNEKARVALTQLTGEIPPAPTNGLPAAASPRTVTQTLESWLLAILALAALVAVIAVISVVGNIVLTPKPTATETYTPTITYTPSITFTPSYTPGGPTITPTYTPTSVQQTLPPTWTPSSTFTPGPTNTPRPTDTATVSETPTLMPTLRPTVTRLPTYTPGGPSDTPEPPTDEPTTTPSATRGSAVTATPSQTS